LIRRFLESIVSAIRKNSKAYKAKRKMDFAPEIINDAGLLNNITKKIEWR